MTKDIDIKTLTNIITLDGPAGSGKSTLAKRIAARLGYAFLDTGAMYRAATWWAMHNNVDMTDKKALAESTNTMPLKMKENNGTLKVYIDSKDISEAIRTPEVTNAIKNLDGIPEVRKKMVRLQQQIASQAPTVADGRDMGTVVFPFAKTKVFLDADLEERTRRRALELKEKGIPFNPEVLKSEIHQRDENDRNRSISPLKPAEDALILDTSNMSIDEVEEAIIQYAREKS